MAQFLFTEWYGEKLQPTPVEKRAFPAPPCLFDECRSLDPSV